MKTESRSASGGEARSERWRLYDAGCSMCAALAREVETRSGGRLRVRSLRDPTVQALLNQARPDWRWEPMLLEIEGERVRVFTGLAMRVRLVQVLGPVQALRAAQAVARHGGPVLGVDWERRRLLQQGGTLAGLALLGRWISFRPRFAFAASRSEMEGEVWEGFLLLPAGAPLPAWVQSSPTPFLCQSDPDEATVAPRSGAILRFDRFEEIAPRLSFPLYFPDILSSEFTFYGIYVTIFQQTDRLLPSARGYLALWLEQSVLYILIAEHDRRRESFINIAQSLRKVSKR